VGGATSGTGGIATSTTPGQLTMLIRDFKFYDANDATTDPDFENVPKTDQSGNPSTNYLGPWDDKDIVADQLGSDHKPVYKNPSGTTLASHGQAAFDKWYRDVDGTNIPQAIPLTLNKNADGTYSYDSLSAGPPLSPGGGFFPIDDGTTYATKFGNQREPHNYSFTVEIHTVFTYQGGETFNFSGDDDVFVYIDNQLVINLGGVHGREPASVALDSLGLTQGTSYPLDFFSAERHMTQSNLLITTSLGLSTNPDIPIN
jgi:fibro-slime domain-containing protein